MKKHKRNSPAALDPAPIVRHEPSTRRSLKEIRDTVSHERTETNRIIAELSTWSDEINATIAFLKSR
jgi:hypothetical protein